MYGLLRVDEGSWGVWLNRDKRIDGRKEKGKTKKQYQEKRGKEDFSGVRRKGKK